MTAINQKNVDKISLEEPQMRTSPWNYKNVQIIGPSSVAIPFKVQHMYLSARIPSTDKALVKDIIPSHQCAISTPTISIFCYLGGNFGTVMVQSLSQGLKPSIMGPSILVVLLEGGKLPCLSLTHTHALHT